MKPRAKLPKSGGAKATTKPANKGKPKAKAQPPVQAREDATTSEEAVVTTTSTEVTAPVEDTPDEGPSALAKAEGEEEEESHDTESAEEGEKGADGAQTRARMLQRHKQELREVKKARGKSKAEVKKMEHELRAKQQAELHALDRELAALRPKRVPKPPTPKANDSDDDDDGETGSSDDGDEKGPTPDAQSGEQQKGPKKPSRAARRKQKREAEDREREKRIEEERKNAGPSAKALEIRRLMDKLGPKGLRITEVAADGNCLYSAVGDQIKRAALSGPHSIVELRRLAADYILDHPDDFLPFLIAGEELPPGGLKKYCDEPSTVADDQNGATNQLSTQLKRDGVWGGQLELRALAQSLKVPIVVHSADAPELKMGEEFQRDPLQLTFHRHYYALGEHYNSVAVAGEVNAE